MALRTDIGGVDLNTHARSEPFRLPFVMNTRQMIQQQPE